MTTSKPLTIRLHDSDNVAVARMDLAVGTEIPQEKIICVEPVAFGHKVAVFRIQKGETVDGGTTVEEMGERIFKCILEVASGKKTKSELNGIGDDESVPWKVGATM